AELRVRDDRLAVPVGDVRTGVVGIERVAELVAHQARGLESGAPAVRSAGGGRVADIEVAQLVVHPGQAFARTKVVPDQCADARLGTVAGVAVEVALAAIDLDHRGTCVDRIAVDALHRLVDRLVGSGGPEVHDVDGDVDIGAGVRARLRPRVASQS